MARGEITNISPLSVDGKKLNTYQRIAGAVSRAIVRMTSRDEIVMSPSTKAEKIRSLTNEKGTSCTIIDYHGDDSAIAAPSFHVVSDGVSGTISSSAPLAQSLVISVGTELAQLTRKTKKTGVNMKGFLDSVARGVGKSHDKFGENAPSKCMQATLSAMFLDQATNILYTLTVGDSKTIVVRPSNDGARIVFETAAVLSDFNSPVVISTNAATDGFSCCQTAEYHVEKGDIILTFSDGVSDNVFGDDIANYAAKYAHEGPEEVSNGIADLARDYSMMSSPENPWVLAAAETYFARAKVAFYSSPNEHNWGLMEESKRIYQSMVARCGDRVSLNKETYPRGMRNRYSVDQLKLCANHGRGKIDDISVAVTIIG